MEEVADPRLHVRGKQDGLELRLVILVSVAAKRVENGRSGRGLVAGEDRQDGGALPFVGALIEDGLNSPSP